MTDREKDGVRVNVEDDNGDDRGFEGAEQAKAQGADEQENAENEEQQRDEAPETEETDWQKKFEDEHEKRLRAAADLQNFRRRVNERRAEQMKFANEKLLTDLLEVLDNFDQALCSMDQEETDTDALLQGVQMIHRQLEDLAARYGVSEISAEGEKFDPNYHEAVERVETDKFPEMTIVEVTSPGYMLHDRLLRPARVRVAVSPQTEQAEAGD